MPPIYISFFTTGSKYEQEARELASSLDRFGLSRKIYEMPDLNDWDKNVLQKADVIERAWKEFDAPLVYLDADAVVVKYPELFDNLNCDIAVHFRKRAGLSFYCGTMYFGRSAMSERILEDWLIRCRRREKAKQMRLPAPYFKVCTDNWSDNDQGALVNTYLGLLNIGARPDFYDLPKPYCAKMKSTAKVDPVILHKQRSVQYRKSYNEEEE